MIWNYYKNLAEKIGIENGIEQPYSVSWFYEQNDPENMNSLTKAFLGDDNALEGICCISDEEAEADIQEIRAYCTDMVNQPQLRAIAHALRDDICIIQGPPGTGKTQTICNILRCLMSRPERPSVAVVSSNGEAIQNIVDIVKEDELLQNCYAFLGRKENRESFYRSHSDAEWASEFSPDNEYRFSPQLLQEYPIIFSTIHSLRKCFVTNAEFTGTFDYVIVDECSQVGNMLGLLAMASANKLVLLGDDKQLSPIFIGTGDDVQEPEGIMEFYLDKGDNSFMKAVGIRFSGRIGNGFLSMHYRCHPAIIGYCNKYVYDDQLQICSRDDGKLPIRIRWYEGDYLEDIIENGNKSKQNLKQIMIFMKEEYPGILAKMREDEDYSVCVLSPYRDPLERLKQELIVYNERMEEDLEEPEIEADGFNPVEKIPQLTIHKAQGRGYDLVVFLTIMDCGSNVWAQRRAIINVAVSRAKKELLLIASSIWMIQDMQKEYLGYSINSGAEHDQLFLRYMMDYVKEQSLQRDPADYGLQRSGLRSVFDMIPYYRERRRNDNSVSGNMTQIGDPSSPELCMLKALHANKYIRDNYEIYREVPLSEVDAISTEDEECRNYIDNGTRFDIVLVRHNKISAIIEVDGIFHRTDEEQKKNDVLKNAAVSSLGTIFKERRFFRFSTDGTSWDEVTKVVNALQAESDDLPEVETEEWSNFNIGGEKMRYVGYIEMNGGFYNFKVNHYIDGRGKINQASPSQVRDDMENRLDCTSIMDRAENQITIWVLRDEGNEALDQLSDGQKLIWNLDLNNVTLRSDNSGFTTVTDYTAVDDFEDISSVFPVLIDDFGTVTDELADKLMNARGIVENWIAEKQTQYGVNNLRDLDGENKNIIVTELNNLFPDFDNPNYGEIYGNPYRTAAYLYKYGFAYTYLYKSMYRDILNLMDADENINVLSIGCGAKLDMAGLKLALLDTNREEAAYYGIDLNDWTNNDNENFCLFNEQGCFEVVNIIDYLTREINNYNAIKENIIVFPYSMSELVDAGEPWNTVLERLPGRLVSDIVYIASNIRAGRNEESDERAFSQLIEAMRNAGYVPQEPIIMVRGIENTMYISNEEDGRSLSDALHIGDTNDNEDTVAGYLKSIKNIDDRIKCNALVGTKYIRYNVARFIRNN